MELTLVVRPCVSKYLGIQSAQKIELGQTVCSVWLIWDNCPYIDENFRMIQCTIMIA